MPATPSRIAFITQPGRSAVWTSSTMRTLYGKSARDTLDEPVETFFDSVTDAQSAMNARGALIGDHARRFAVEIDELLDFSGALDFSQTLPGARLVDDEKLADMNVVVTAVSALDFETGKTTIAVWGIV